MFLALEHFMDIEIYECVAHFGLFDFNILDRGQPETWCRGDRDAKHIDEGRHTHTRYRTPKYAPAEPAKLMCIYITTNLSYELLLLID